MGAHTDSVLQSGQGVSLSMGDAFASQILKSIHSFIRCMFLDV